MIFSNAVFSFQYFFESLMYCDAVIRELDFLRRREESKARASDVLEWIESCMLEIPFWIHVQRSAETVLVAMTPPVSPSIYTRYMATFYYSNIGTSMN